MAGWGWLPACMGTHLPRHVALPGHGLAGRRQPQVRDAGLLQASPRHHQAQIMGGWDAGTLGCDAGGNNAGLGQHAAATQCPHLHGFRLGGDVVVPATLVTAVPAKACASKPYCMVADPSDLLVLTRLPPSWAQQRARCAPCNMIASLKPSFLAGGASAGEGCAAALFESTVLVERTQRARLLTGDRWAVVTRAWRPCWSMLHQA